MSKPSSGGRSSGMMTRFVLGGTVLLLLGGIVFALYTFATLKMSYSDGERSGILQKFSRKGWLCKTYEGEIAMSYAPGLAPTQWAFTVRDADVATQVNQALGRKVVLHYTEHRGVPSECFGETLYFVDGVRSLD